MKRTTSKATVRVSVAEAKAGLSRLLRSVDRQDVVIHNRGRDVARLVALDGTEGRESASEPSAFTTFFNRLELVKRSVGLRGVQFEPKKAAITPREVFGVEE